MIYRIFKVWIKLTQICKYICMDYYWCVGFIKFALKKKNQSYFSSALNIEFTINWGFRNRWMLVGYVTPSSLSGAFSDMFLTQSSKKRIFPKRQKKSCRCKDLITKVVISLPESMRSSQKPPRPIHLVTCTTVYAKRWHCIKHAQKDIFPKKQCSALLKFCKNIHYWKLQITYNKDHIFHTPIKPFKINSMIETSTCPSSF